MADSSSGWLHFSVPPGVVAPRGVPRFCFLRAVVSHFPSPHLGVGDGGVSGAWNIGKLWKNPPKFGGLQGGLANF